MAEKEMASHLYTQKGIQQTTVGLQARLSTRAARVKLMSECRLSQTSTNPSAPMSSQEHK